MSANFKKILEGVALIGGLITSLAAIYSLIQNVNSKLVEPSITFLNALILFAACVFLKSDDTNLTLSPKGSDEDKAKVHRVNALVKQLNTNLLYFALPLIIVYSLYFSQIIWPSSVTQGITGWVIPIGNFISSYFVYLAFQVLYNETLDINNRRNNYYIDSLIFSLLFLGCFVVIKVNPDFAAIDPKRDVWGLRFTLIIGVLNGVTMGLLFSRIISMENVLVNLYDQNNSGGPLKTRKKIIHKLTIFILPVYAVIQPLFGLFDIEQNWGEQEVLKSFVFAICLIGKIWFFIIFVYYLRKRWLHVFFFYIVSRHGIPPDYKDKIELPNTVWG